MGLIDGEIREIKQAIEALKGLWLEFYFYAIQKMHILTCHTLDQVIMFGGITGKVEDFIEKVYQIGKKWTNWLPA